MTTDLGVTLDRKGAVLEVRLSAPTRANALTGGSVGVISRALTDARSSLDGPDPVRAILLTAEGKNFCAGADLRAANSPSAGRLPIGAKLRQLLASAHGLIAEVWELPIPTVAAVYGTAAGLGSHLALACDVVVAGAGSRFVEPFVDRGFTPDSGATFLLSRLVGTARAKSMLMLGEPVDGPRAAEWGLIYECVPDEQVVARARGLAERLAHGPTFVLGLTKHMVHMHAAGDIRSALSNEAVNVELSLRGKDFKEGIKAFMERREPCFEGR